MRVLPIVAIAAVACWGVPAGADWAPGDGHKMHFPQLPDPFGWDVEFVSWSNELAEDWECSSSGTVDDIHFWMSWAHDYPGVLGSIGVTIYDNIPDPDPSDPSTFSQPGNALWSRVFVAGEFNVVQPAGTGDQGFYAPQANSWQQHDHQTFDQINIQDIANPFTQTAGEIYWLGLWVAWEGTQEPAGWKTSQDHFMDIPVWWDYINEVWNPIYDPVTGAPLSMAFVITPEPASLGLLLGGLLIVLRRR